MKAGKLRDLITIQRLVETGSVDAGGHPLTTTSVFAKVWGNVQPLTGREFWNAQQVASEVTHKVTTRYLDGITTEMQLRLEDGTILYLKGKPRKVQENREIELEMLCGEKE